MVIQRKNVTLAKVDGSYTLGVNIKAWQGVVGLLVSLLALLGGIRVALTDIIDARVSVVLALKMPEMAAAAEKSHNQLRAERIVADEMLSREINSERDSRREGQDSLKEGQRETLDQIKELRRLMNLLLSRRN